MTCPLPDKDTKYTVRLEWIRVCQNKFVKSAIDRHYPLEQIAEAPGMSKPGRKRVMSSSWWNITTKPNNALHPTAMLLAS